MYLAICDDDGAQLEQMTALLTAYRQEKLPSLRWCEFSSGEELLAALQDTPAVDAVLLDIFMDGMTGMEAARSIRAAGSKVHILFLTSSADFAVESYQVNAADYLLKPITRERLFPGLDKLYERLREQKNQGLVLRDGEGGITRYPYRQLMYLEAMGRFGVLYRVDGDPVRTTLSFTELARLLEQSGQFVQIHRSYMVNMHCVHRLTKGEVFLLDGTALPLSRSRQQSVCRRFLDYSFGGGAIE